MQGWSGMSVQDAFDLLGADPYELWTRYLALGGSLSAPDFETVLRDRAVSIGPGEHSVIAQTLNEAFLDQGMDQFPGHLRGEISDPVWPSAVALTGSLAHWVSKVQIASPRRHDVTSELLARTGKAEFAASTRRRARAAKQHAARAKKAKPGI
jgi:hypothetical protein